MVTIMANGKKVLIVDDHKGIIKNTKRLLELSGYEVSSAYDGNTALALYKQEQQDVVITDFNMPGLTGLQLAKQIRQYEAAGKHRSYIILASGRLFKIEDVGEYGIDAVQDISEGPKVLIKMLESVAA